MMKSQTASFPPLRLDKLQQKLGYQFNDIGLLQSALTHRSAAASNNERLEFLGDSILGLAVSRALFDALPDLNEGDLSRMRSKLVQGETLSKVAHELELGPHLQLGQGERASGGRRRASILADAVEAILGAIYLDSDYGHTEAVIRRIWAERLANLPSVESLKDPKTRLQEALQGRGQGLPEYILGPVRGKQHEQVFTIVCKAADISCEAEGGSRRKAEQAAATIMLEKLNQ